MLREMKYDHDVEIYSENPPSHATPSGRAYSWFERLQIELPQAVQLVDGPYPGSNWMGVVVKNVESLIILQEFLENNGFQVNFDLQK
jgi:hypothetical protein